ncbi:PIG-L deacetylase family protein [Roseomonas populi]|uniref:PIG-L family deacetylase n=1 Tax=Roseomonas populi TaxID=3121582 RepID=A0ABT1XC50_9PROT|nr:PIG-L deacetylase family protein [Roseomonas pecuniae]MCR0984574.1 PIG-L family deacetylase [Roseomonas pecuniae]
MRASDFLREAEALPLVPLHALLPEGGVLVLAPHPDDESLGCGGLLAAMAAAGRPARVVVMSDGAGSHPNSRTHPGPVLRELRREEAIEAAEELGVPAPLFLDLPDGDVPTSGARFEETVRAVIAAAEGLGTIAATIGLDPHKDHEATWAIAKEASRRAGLRLLGYPVWSWRHLYPAMAPIAPVELPAPPRGMRLDVSAQMETKRRAVMAHRSQVTRLIKDDPSGFILSPAVLSVLMRPFEVYLEEAA